MHQKLEDYTEQEIIEGIKNNDNHLIELLKEDFFPRIKSMTFRSKGDNHKASTIFNDIILAIKVKAINGTYEFQDKLAHYFMGKTHGDLLNLYSEKKRRAEKEINLEAQQLENLSDDKSNDWKYLEPESEKMKLVYPCINKLPPKDQEFIKLKFTEGYTLDELINHFDDINNRNYVRQRQFRIINKIRKCLGLKKINDLWVFPN